jgi:serine phosphatase RsbU (regulator of sigma subunit)
MKIPRNPYLNRSMIRTPAAFFGRQRETARLAARIASDPPQSVAIVGDRRIGKSSLLNYISHPEVVGDYLEEPEKTIFLFLDFQEEQRLSIESFIEAVFRHLREKLGDRYEIRVGADYEGLQEVVRELDGLGYRLILLLDEFDRVTRNSRFDANFFGSLRSLAGHYNIAFVTSTNRDLQQLCHTEEISDSPFFNIFSNLYLGPITPREARGLICDPSAETPFPLEEHADLILSMGGFFPFFLQMACSATFELLLEEGECRPEQVTDRFLEEAQPHFQFYWDQMDPVERALGNDLACEKSVDKERPQYQDLEKRGFVLPQGGLFSDPFAGFVRRAYAQEVGEEPMEVQAERLRSMEGELEKARSMQMGLLPQERPQAKGIDLAGRCEPASQVGGDFFTYLWLDEEQTLLGIVGVDVMGHGMEGAVTALRFSETLRYEARGRTQAEDIMSGLNRALHGTLPAGAFVGCGIVVIDLKEWRVEAVVAGYNPPLHFDRDQREILEPDLGGMPLGIRPDSEYKGVVFPVEKGDYLLIYSDGVTEAMDDREMLYGDERLMELLVKGAEEGLEAEGVLERLFWDVGRFSASTGQMDDITAIAVRVTGGR